MSVTSVFSKGKPMGHPNVTSILKYIPRPRVPWQPSRFSRGNLDDADMAQLWSRGRYRSGPGNFNSGYATEKTHLMEDSSVSIIPKSELEKYMPDIAIPGGKALVTPVSLMSARNGHRVTHDMLHSYDPHIGRLQRAAQVDHSRISVEDPNRVGLNAATLDCRGRIHRWLRRGPFFQEDHYFRRTLRGEDPTGANGGAGQRLQRDGGLPAPSVHEVPLMKKIVLLAQKGKLKDACEAYRSVTSVPPVEVYRALMEACVPNAQLADAIAIFEDGNAKLFYVARDGEVLYHLMHCAIRAKARVRVMWVFQVLCGRYYENVLVRAEIDAVWRFRITLLALHFFLDTEAGEEAKAVYRYLRQEGLLDADLSIRLGQSMALALKEGKSLPKMPLQAHEYAARSFLATPCRAYVVTPDCATTPGGIEVDAALGPLESLALYQNALRMTPLVAQAVYRDYFQSTVSPTSDDAVEADEALWRTALPLLEPPPLTSMSSDAESHSSSGPTSTSEGKERQGQQCLVWLEKLFPDVAVLSVMRHARFRLPHQQDLLQPAAAEGVEGTTAPQVPWAETYVSRVVQWLFLLSSRATERDERPLPYLRKSKASITNEHVRVAHPWCPSAPHQQLVAESGTALTNRGRLLPSEEGYTFRYTTDMRMVTETFAHLYEADAVQSRLLPQRPLHVEVPESISLLPSAAVESSALLPPTQHTRLSASSAKPGEEYSSHHPSLWKTASARGVMPVDPTRESRSGASASLSPGKDAF